MGVRFPYAPPKTFKMERPYNQKFTPQDQIDVDNLVDYYKRDMKAGSVFCVEILGIKLSAKILEIPGSGQMTLQLMPPVVGGTIVY